MIKITEFEKLICEESIIINHDLHDYMNYNHDEDNVSDFV